MTFPAHHPQHPACLPPSLLVSAIVASPPHKPHCWLTNKINNSAAINRASRIPTTNERTGCRLGLTSFDPAPFCAAPRPNQKRSLSIALSAIIGAALWWPYYAYGYGEFPYSASAKSPNPGQGYLARRHHER